VILLFTQHCNKSARADSVETTYKYCAVQITNKDGTESCFEGKADYILHIEERFDKLEQRINQHETESSLSRAMNDDPNIDVTDINGKIYIKRSALADLEERVYALEKQINCLRVSAVCDKDGNSIPYKVNP
jgi:uncharacterized protein YlzI (FlbEa/FlbD family)